MWASLGGRGARNSGCSTSSTPSSYLVLFVISSSLGQLYSLAVILPTIAVGIRRMHDTNRSGWWIVVPIVNIVFAATEGDRNENQFGPDPKAGEAA